METVSPEVRVLPDALSDPATGPALSWFDDQLSPARAWDGPALDADSWCVLAPHDVVDHVRMLAAGLIAAGVAPGERVALMMSNRPEHWLVDQAVLHAGAIPSTFYPTLSAEQVRAQAAHAQIGTVIVEGAEQIAQWELALPSVRRVIVVDENRPPISGHAGYATYTETRDRGRALLRQQPDVVADRRGRVTPDDIATIIFTSGTTSVPKAVPLSHTNVLAGIRGLLATGALPDSYRIVSHLPMAHIAERVASLYGPLLLCGQVSFSPVAAMLSRVAVRTEPTVHFGVPRIWEKTLDQLTTTGTCASADVLRRGGLHRVEWAASAGAPIKPDILAGLRELGLPLVNVWGLTETAGVTAATATNGFRTGTVGRALPGTEVRTAPDGELLVRGPHIAAGYLQPDGTTAGITDADGWLPTGDVGAVDDDGYIRITDRKKEIIVTSGGKNVSPVAVEAVLTRSPLISQAIAYGNDRPYLVALLTLEAEYARGWLRTEHGVDAAALPPSELAGHPVVLAEVTRAVEQANASLARAEQIKRWELVAQPWSPADGGLTATLKLRRPIIQQRHQAVLDRLYHGEPARKDTVDGPEATARARNEPAR